MPGRQSSLVAEFEACSIWIRVNFWSFVGLSNRRTDERNKTINFLKAIKALTGFRLFIPF